MARPIRIEYPDAFYHVISRGNERRAVFRGDDDYELFLSTLEEASDRFDTLIHAYCLMANHLHLLIQTKDSNLSQFMKRLLGVYTIRFNRRHKRQGHLFQGRYKAYLIDQDSYFLQLSRYIHLNPVKAKLSVSAEKYRWSSMQFFLRRDGPSCLYKKLTLDSFDSPKAYQAFVKEGIGRNSDLPKPTAGCILGSEAFIKNFTKHIQKYKDKDVSGKKELYRMPAPKLRQLTQGKDLSFQMYCLWKYGRLTQRSIGEMFSRTHAAVSQNIYRFGARLVKDKILDRELKVVLSEFKD
ncbi:MAG: transposase [Candidatus Omnitrophica bacterium]|nr:transposase [Candidatus Omnitrophota bacterium]